MQGNCEARNQFDIYDICFPGFLFELGSIPIHLPNLVLESFFTKCKREIIYKGQNIQYIHVVTTQEPNSIM